MLLIPGRNACKPERGIETNHRDNTSQRGYQVGTLVSPNEGLKPFSKHTKSLLAKRRNACKPERGIETGKTALCRSQSTRVGTLVSPNEGLKLAIVCRRWWRWSWVGTLVSPNEGLKPILPRCGPCGKECRNACKPERGIETNAVGEALPPQKGVGTLVSPNEGLKHHYCL